MKQREKETYHKKGLLTVDNKLMVTRGVGEMGEIGKGN